MRAMNTSQNQDNPKAVIVTFKKQVKKLENVMPPHLLN